MVKGIQSVDTMGRKDRKKVNRYMHSIGNKNGCYATPHVISIPLIAAIAAAHWDLVIRRIFGLRNGGMLGHMQIVQMCILG